MKTIKKKPATHQLHRLRKKWVSGRFFLRFAVVFYGGFALREEMIMSGELPNIRFTDSLPNLITPDDYRQENHGCKIRVQIRQTEEGVEIIGDSRHIVELESLLAAAGIREMERVLCG
jgi:hypothetical protein